MREGASLHRVPDSLDRPAARATVRGPLLPCSSPPGEPSLRKLWRHWYGKLLIVLPILLVVFAATSLVAASYTERSSFCVSACHEMHPYGTTWKASVHRDVACVKCHIKPGFVSLVKAKGSALREVYVHFAGEVKAPIAVTEHVPDSTCRQSGCHARSATYDRVVLRSTATLAATASGGAAPGASATVLLVATPLPGARPFRHRPRPLRRLRRCSSRTIGTPAYSASSATTASCTRSSPAGPTSTRGR